MSIPDRWPREPDDLDFSGSSSYEVESDEQYRCPWCGYIGTATLHVQRQHGRDYVDVECGSCGHVGPVVIGAGDCWACAACGSEHIREART